MKCTQWRSAQTGRNWPLAVKITRCASLEPHSPQCADHTRAHASLGHLGPVFTVAFSPTSPILATGGDENSAILWDLEERPPAALGSPPIGHHDGVNWVAFGGGGNTLALRQRRR